ncbi:secondary thiamine-phosphate synthase enzyme YjbQ [Petroclostridium sp. X23]|jgi:secondary thiamine-phosphate synthase enzyme|uniref:secondary thiamine-phosphate synthase enzyme YjbQ n=1 Tax=Petroclostridium sp. X23 TaxID=3045146 RepID=UPI0024AE0124|nr:secondary thiamine-phosphate synthase enzyme YjbQ [Petroclostridium sp. X23]WHH60108.1 secondary thiamine-phosphate synthase enzyme YjbQ [Petroclostridium sp. X23]
MITKLITVPIRAQKSDVELIKITDRVKQGVKESGITNGIVFVITAHTTTGITVNESLPCVEADIVDNMERLIPADHPYNHNHFLHSYGTIGGNTPGHLKAMLTGNHCAYPVQDGEVVFGDAQDIYFAEYDGIKNRKYFIYMMGV